MLQHVERDEGGFFAEQAQACVGRFAVPLPADWLEHAAVGEDGVEAGQFFHRHLAAAEGERQAVVFFRRQIGDATALQQVVEAGASQSRGHRYGGYIAAADQRLLRADRANKTAVEIFRAERAEGGRCILQHGRWMEHALVECQRIDEGLQR